MRAGRLAAAGLVASLLIASVPGGVAAQTLVPPASASSSFGLPPEPSSTATQGQATASPYTTAVAPAAPPQPVTIQDSTTAQTTPGAQPSATQPSAGAQTTVSPVQTLEMLAPVRPVAKPGEFEKYVAATLGEPIPRFGAALMLPAPPLGAEPFTPPTTAIVPPDYLLNPGDEIVMGLTGSVEGEIHLTIDSNGRVFLPHIGPVDLAGVRYGDLQALLTRRVGQQYRNFKLSVAIGQLHGITVYVTGYAVTPGAYTLSSLSTLVNAVIASGGPNAGGSFRNIELRRGGEVVTDFDFYDLLLRGDKTHDATLQNEDVIFIGPTGPQAAITGSVNQQAIYEAKSGETLADLLQDAGGFSSLSDRSRVFVERLSTLDTTGWQQLDLSSALPMPIERGDILRVTSVADYARPQERQAIVVKIEGEVDHPGRYYLKPDSTLGDLLAQAGGLTPRAFLFGTELDRVTVRKQQQAGFDQAVDNLELSVAAAPLGASPALNGDLGTQNSRAQLARQVIEQLRAFQPSGRLVLGMTIQSTALPADFLLENDDRIYIPPTPTSVGVFGAVYEPGSFAFQPARHIGDYLRQSGGPDKIADRSDVFVVRANGAVISTRQQGWGSSLASQPALPGDVIFVPVRTQPNLFWDRLVQVTSVLYNVALGAAAIKVLGQ